MVFNCFLHSLTLSPRRSGVSLCVNPARPRAHALDSRLPLFITLPFFLSPSPRSVCLSPARFRPRRAVRSALETCVISHSFLSSLFSLNRLTRPPPSAGCKPLTFPHFPPLTFFFFFSCYPVSSVYPHAINDALTAPYIPLFSFSTSLFSPLWFYPFLPHHPVLVLHGNLALSPLSCYLPPLVPPSDTAPLSNCCLTPAVLGPGG